MDRVQLDFILKDLKKKMVFLVGPRQVGKTWLSKKIMESYSRPLYLNYDQAQDRLVIQNQSWPQDTDLLVLDELHKLPKWKLFLKGLYDTKPPHLAILVTGSARLDTFRKAGDSLAGRFFTHRLMPLSPAELSQLKIPYTLQDLIEKSGFPEPFLAQTTIDAMRWRNQYIDGLIREDILYLETVHNLKSMQLLVELLRARVGSPISYTSLAQDIGVSSPTIKKYIDILEALFIVFRVTPWTKNIARSLLKEPKLYFYDTGLVTANEGAKFENLAAVCLLKHTYAEQDYLGKQTNLYYIRTKDGQEVDFCLASTNKPDMMIECKVSDTSISSYAYTLQKKWDLPVIWLIQNLRLEQDLFKISLRKASPFLEKLYL